jgi:predicted NAD-dependent protein-ADP-ribosyltransferase YbiA (DUF1768 family)
MEEISQESQEKHISVYNPVDFPFGVLSSNNISPFSMTGKERAWGYPKLIEGNWKSVTQFVYVNMFSDANRRSQMIYSVPFGFGAMIAIQAEIDRSLFEEYVKQGLFKKITGNRNLLYKLSNIKAYNLVYEETPYIIDVLNQIRYPKNKLVYYSLDKQPPEAIFVSLNEAASVLHGIEIEIEKGSVFEDNETYINLIKWSKPVQPEPGMIDWIDLDNLVPLARLRLRNKKTIQNIEIFKNLLLDTFLDYILETEYPYLEKSLYERAKTQQLEKETQESIQSLKNQLYELFLIGGITDVHRRILQRTHNYQPQQFVLEPYPVKTNNTSLNESIDLSTVPELLPSYESMASIDGKQYITVIHYVYDMLIQKMLKIYPGLDLSNFDINNVRIEELPTIYADIQKQWTERTLLINNEAALEAKLKQHSSILHFLFQSDPYQILWEDVHDAILGVFDGTGKNMTGNHLMFLRETMKRTIVKNTFTNINTNLASNNILQLWLYNTSLHLRNTLLLFDSPKTIELEHLYSVHTSSVKQRPPNTVEKQILEQAGLTSVQIKAAFPMILVLASKEFGDESISEIQIAKSSLRRYTEKQKQYLKYNNPEDYEEAFEVSKQYLSQATENIKLAPDVDIDIFVKSMLAGRRVQPDEQEFTPNLENLNIWSSSFSFFVVQQPTDLPFIINEQPTTDILSESNLTVPIAKDGTEGATVTNYKKTIKMRMGKKGIKEVKNKPLEYENTVDATNVNINTVYDNTVDENEDNPKEEELDALGELLEQMIS